MDPDACRVGNIVFDGPLLGDFGQNWLNGPLDLFRQACGFTSSDLIWRFGGAILFSARNVCDDSEQPFANSSVLPRLPQIANRRGLRTEGTAAVAPVQHCPFGALN